MIVDGFHMNAQLPGSVEAFVVNPGDNMDGMLEVYRAWQREYPEANVPLLAFLFGKPVFIEKTTQKKLQQA